MIPEFVSNTHGLTDKSVTFDKAFAGVPHVQLTRYSTSTNPAYGSTDVAVLSVSKTGFSIRFF